LNWGSPGGTEGARARSSVLSYGACVDNSCRHWCSLTHQPQSSGWILPEVLARPINMECGRFLTPRDDPRILGARVKGAPLSARISMLLGNAAGFLSLPHFLHPFAFKGLPASCPSKNCVHFSTHFPVSDSFLLLSFLPVMTHAAL
jgi:hypothetical protein